MKKLLPNIIYNKYTIILPLLLLMGCSTVTVDFTLRPLKGAEVLDEYGDPVPAAIRAYQLKEDSRFNNIPAHVLFKKDLDILKADLLERKRTRIFWDKEASLSFKKAKGVEYIGIISMIKKDDINYTWKRIFSINDKRMKDVEIQLKKDSNIISLHLIPTKNMNAEKPGVPLPASVRIYQLKSDERFKQADFKSLWKKDKESLAEDLIDSKKLNLYPANQKNVIIKKNDTADFIGIVGIFRKPKNDNTWKGIIDLTDSFYSDINIIFNKNNIEIEPIRKSNQNE